MYTEEFVNQREYSFGQKLNIAVNNVLKWNFTKVSNADIFLVKTGKFGPLARQLWH